MMGMFRVVIIVVGMVGGWHVLVQVTGVPAYILPPPIEVLRTFQLCGDELLNHSLVTLSEIILGFLVGVIVALSIAHLMIVKPWTQNWLMPVSIGSQAIPVFALAPILVLWLGYGMASKVTMTALIVFFPVVSAAFDGLKRTPPEMLDLARVMTRETSNSTGQIVRHLRWPMALPTLGSGLKIAAATSPIGAVIGEWVGASAGLGHAMLKANSRAETDMMFACVIALMVMGIVFYLVVDGVTRFATPWAASSLEGS